ncbi:hypothetical protein [Burkholderia humptydooensis]|nr:hypothetical protein [Burkholderia humptydooensis]
MTAALVEWMALPLRGERASIRQASTGTARLSGRFNRYCIDFDY